MDTDTDEIDDQAWDLIMKCCPVNRNDQADLSQIKEMLTSIDTEEDCRPPATPLLLPEIQVLRSQRPEIDPGLAEHVLRKVQVSRIVAQLPIGFDTVS